MKRVALILALLLLPSMAWAQALVHDFGLCKATACSGTFTCGPITPSAAGDILAVAMGSTSSSSSTAQAISSISDGTNTWAAAKNCPAPAAGFMNTSFDYTSAPIAGSAITLTITLSGSASGTCDDVIDISEYSGMNTPTLGTGTNPGCTDNGGQNTPLTATFGPVTTTGAATQLLITGLGTYDNNTFSSSTGPTIGTKLSAGTGTNNTAGLFAGYDVVTSTGTYSGTWTITLTGGSTFTSEGGALALVPGAAPAVSGANRSHPCYLGRRGICP